MRLSWPGWAGRGHSGAVLILVMLPVLANGLALLGIVNPDPAIEQSGLARVTAGAIFPGGSPDWFDGATGSISQALAILSAHDWLHGIIPWWNPYTGAGMPLAAEMAGFSFFLPFSLLFAVDNGFIIFRVVIQILSGLAMYGLLMELKLDRAAALMGGALFGLSATFFQAPQAIGPLPFLPLLLLGVEAAARVESGEMRLGWLVIPLALAYSVYGSFPEISFFDGLFAASWVIWRCAGLGAAGRRKFLARIALQTCLGIMMALPLIVPFLSYVKLSFLGDHQAYFSHAVLRMPIVPVTIFPFVYGEINGPSMSSPAFPISLSGFGGWLGLPPVFLAVAAIAKPGIHRSLVYFLSAFVLFWILRSAGFQPVIDLLNLVPFAARTNAVRFCWPSLEAAVFILAALAVDNWVRADGDSRRPIMFTGILVSILCVALLILARHISQAIDFNPPPPQLAFAAIFCLGSILVCLCLAWLTCRVRPAWGVSVAVGLVIAQAFATFFALQLPAPRATAFDMAGVSFLKKNLGLERIFSLGALNSDYPAAFGISAIDSYALPVDKRWVDYVHTHLNANADPILFRGFPNEPAGSDPAEALNVNFKNYLALGLKYVLTPANDYPFESRKPLPLRGNTGRTITLQGGDSVTGSIPGRLVGFADIRDVDVLLGTFVGQSTGTLSLQICAGNDCARGVIDLTQASDDQFNKFILDRDLQINPKSVLTYQFTHSRGYPAALWIYDFDGVPPEGLTIGQESPGISPWFRFDLKNPAIDSQLVFHDDMMDIYQVSGTTPFYSTSVPCRLSGEDLNRLSADCPAPAVLTRLEAWYPGWQVRVNGVTSTPALTGALFQSVKLPAGHSYIRFSYMPVGTRWSVSLAGLALLIWVFQIIRRIRLN